MEAMAHSELAKLSLDLKGLNARPLWERTARMGPGSPAVPTIWRYRDMRPQLLRAIELITAKEAERRVFMLENPGLPGTGYITSSLYCGLQVIKPGEIAPAHRHSPNALRFIIEGEGAYSTVEGERVPMHPGDFVLTPGWTWHDHGHLGSAPVIWLDALDNPFGQFFGAIFRENYPGETHPVSQVEGAAAARYGSNLMPVEYRPQRRASPLLARTTVPARHSTAWRATPRCIPRTARRCVTPTRATAAMCTPRWPCSFNGSRRDSPARPIAAPTVPCSTWSRGVVGRTSGTPILLSSRTMSSWCRRGRPITS
jgi:gentisate 1,2-dioxygenase